MSEAKSKEEMIEWLKSEDMSLNDFSLGEEEHGWRLMMGAFEFYLECAQLRCDGIVASSIYESDIK
ncbi:hypothetical protein pA_gene0069 [Vibrio phage 13VT501A]|nr:hypothetical protein pA_gene0069 [Vibrio phage 13VT501A]